MASIEDLNSLSTGTLPGVLGFEVLEAEHGRLRARMDVRQELLAPNGYLHAAAVIALADTSCGFVTRISLPEGATGFTTIELKSSFLATVREGAIACEASMAHGGRTTQVWEARVSDEVDGRPIALFACTQLVLR